MTGLWVAQALTRPFPPMFPSLLSVSVGAFVKTWLPFILLLGIILTISLVFNLR